MLEKIKADLAENFIEGSDDVLKDLIEDITSIASNTSNRKSDDEKLFPYIKRAVKSEYLARGAEGMSSRSEGSISSSYNDIIEKMRNDIIKSGVRRPK